MLRPHPGQLKGVRETESCRSRRRARHQEGGGVPGLTRHAARGERLAVQPFGEGPVAERADPRELVEFRLRLSERPACTSAPIQKPPTIGQMPPLWYCQTKFCRWRAMYGRHSELLAFDGARHRADGIGVAHPRAGERIERARARALHRPSPRSTARTLPKTSPSSPKKEKLTKLRYRSRLRPLRST